MEDWQVKAGELAGPAIENGEATTWFDRLYAAGAAGEVSMPWDRDEPQALLRDWTRRERLKGRGKTAVVVGCGLGADAEYLASLGFDTVGFDVSPTAVRLARERHPDSAVDYRVADLLALPEEWHHGFDLVVEVFTLQALPDPPRGDAARAVAGLVAPGGRLVAVAFRATEDVDPLDGPPFALTRESIEALATDGLRVTKAEELELDGAMRWRVSYHR
jgi:SAM-dependent methyltransferase